jgi:hypothetical protein
MPTRSRGIASAPASRPQPRAGPRCSDDGREPTQVRRRPAGLRARCRSFPGSCRGRFAVTTPCPLFAVDVVGDHASGRVRDHGVAIDESPPGLPVTFKIQLRFRCQLCSSAPPFEKNPRTSRHPKDGIGDKHLVHVEREKSRPEAMRRSIKTTKAKRSGVRIIGRSA